MHVSFNMQTVINHIANGTAPEFIFRAQGRKQILLIGRYIHEGGFLQQTLLFKLASVP